MYPWTDGIEPEEPPMRPTTPADEPPYGPDEQRPYVPRHAEPGRPYRPGEPADRWSDADQTTFLPPLVDLDEYPTQQHVPEGDGEEPQRGRRRFSRPLVAAGAAVATLAVVIGAGAVLAAGNDAQPSTAAESATGGMALPDDTSDYPTESVSPTATASPTFAPTRSATPKPSATRQTAASRSTQRASTTSRTSTSTGTKSSSVAQQVVTLVNQERAKAGCGAVTINSQLTTAAQLHSEDQAAHQKMSHDGSDGSDFVTRAKRAGYQYAIGENVAYGYETAAAVMEGWMNSPGHRANILNCDAKAIGVGVATGGGRLYWTQDFGSRA